MHYNPKIVLAFWKDCGLPAAKPEFKFHPARKWRFDFAFLAGGVRSEELGARTVSDSNSKLLVPSFSPVAIEVQGAIFGTGKPCRVCKQRKQGGHNRGAALEKEHEKRNAAVILGWRILYCTPQQVQTLQFARTIKAALEFSHG